MEPIKSEDVVRALGNLTVLEMIALTRELEAVWGVKAEPAPVTFVPPSNQTEVVVKDEFNVILQSVSAEKKMAVIKIVRELTLLGLKESKELVEAAPKSIKDGVTKAEADELVRKLTEAGAVVEVK